MKLHSTEHTVSRKNVGQETKFSMALNDKLFEIMYGKLYSDKELANVRELSCNAKDAHIDAGTTDTLFEVHLPNTLEPYFGVKDFGTGLTPQQMIDIYTVFFYFISEHSLGYP